MKTLLFVDDEHNLLKSIVRHVVLRHRDQYDVHITVDGYEAIAFMKNREPDCVILDIMMPNMGGVEVCKNVKADPSISNIPIIISSGMIDKDAKETLISMGIEQFLEKPYTMESLFEKIELVIS